ncbi:MAG: hypothetical protein J6K19_02450 [Prevotella sp.]|nr:hypothetical protein [Prevotella sp.]
MKKFLLACGVLLLSCTGISAQTKEGFYGVGNRVGIGVGVGTEGIGLDASVSLTKWCSARVGVNIMPKVLKITQDFDADELGEVRLPDGSYVGLTEPVEAEASFSRTYVDVKFDLYPFPNASSFFLTAGFSFGGNKLIEIKGHSDEAYNLIQQVNDYANLDPDNKFGIDIDEYRIPINEDGDIRGGMKVKGFRPYLGLGFGRLIPKNRLGFRFELGAQFQGKPTIYADGVDLDKTLKEEVKNDISDIMDYLTVYPVIKFSLRGRIL